ncbi:GNAT family N-acetyltransferase [Marinilactibacillus kalidii]|uniref:GNAT family N-acetyltransferase n=1 Tax=Marinilactibacillus kalidii TaxID=2820274 RepID=UPI001ABE92BE|nr:GNAT family N-acetyltransferase [Marinilactibacillus kalidii]
MIEIKIIEAKHQEDIKIKNESFLLWGRMIPSYENESWHYSIRHDHPKEISQMCFPDEAYDYEEMSKHSTFIGAYEHNQCIGLAIIQEAFFNYMYLYDLKVSTTYRKKGIAEQLIEKAKEVCHAKGYQGIHTIAQDNNLSACLFYVHTGFSIGGLDTHVYKGTNQEGKADIHFYLNLP